MTDDEAIEAGLERVRNPHWRWREGMLARATNAWHLDGCDGLVFGSGRVLVDRITATVLVRSGDHVTTLLRGDPFVPDLRDPETMRLDAQHKHG